jgi:hypothetical protein
MKMIRGILEQETTIKERNQETDDSGNGVRQ